MRHFDAGDGRAPLIDGLEEVIPEELDVVSVRFLKLCRTEYLYIPLIARATAFRDEHTLRADNYDAFKRQTTTLSQVSSQRSL